MDDSRQTARGARCTARHHLQPSRRPATGRIDLRALGEHTRLALLVEEPYHSDTLVFLFISVYISASHALLDSLMAYVLTPVHSGYSSARHITLDIARTPIHYYIHLLPLLLEYPLLELFALSWMAHFNAHCLY